MAALPPRAHGQQGSVPSLPQMGRLTPSSQSLQGQVGQQQLLNFPVNQFQGNMLSAVGNGNVNVNGNGMGRNVNVTGTSGGNGPNHCGSFRISQNALSQLNALGIDLSQVSGAQPIVTLDPGQPLPTRFNVDGNI